MRNLLSERTKHTIQREYQFRLLLVGIIFVSVAIVIGAISLFPSYSISNARLSALQSQLQFSGNEADMDKEDTSNIVRTTRVELGLLLELKKQKAFSLKVNAIVTNKPAGVVINDFAYRAQNEEENGSLVIKGVARTRADLLMFDNKLKQDPDFVSVALPISNLAEDRDISFSITIEGAL